MTPRLVVDTHVLIRWLIEPHRLSREQLRALRASVQRGEPVAVSAMTLVELGVLFGKGATRLVGDGAEILRVLESDPGFRILPITVEIAREVRALVQVLRDPADCVIAATARVHGLRLVTSDQRIIAANVVSMVE